MSATDIVAEDSTIMLDGRRYRVCIRRRVRHPPDAPRLVVVSYLPNRTAAGVLRVCLGAIRRFTTIPHELWVVDNHSPRASRTWLETWPDINLVLNRTEPLPPFS